jgi:hypothetical protein
MHTYIHAYIHTCIHLYIYIYTLGQGHSQGVNPNNQGNNQLVNQNNSSNGYLPANGVYPVMNISHNNPSYAPEMNRNIQFNSMNHGQFDNQVQSQMVPVQPGKIDICVYIYI